MRPNLRLHVFLLLPILLFIGCAAIGLNRQDAEFQRPPEYVRFFELLDRTVAEAGVRDASVFTVSGFPYLPTNRFFTGLKDDLKNDAHKEQWVRRLQQLDLEARQKEIRNLPAAALKNLARQLGEPAGRLMLQERAAFYSAKMLTRDQRLPDFYEVVLRAVTDPSEYSTAMRVVGLYPLTSMPVTAVTRSVQEKFRKWHHAPADRLETVGELTVYAPSRGTEYSEQTVRLVLDRSRQNALFILQPSKVDQQTLLAMFAPVITQDVAAGYDKIGEVVWQDNKVRINAAKPTVYYYFSHGHCRYRQHASARAPCRQAARPRTF